jgi:hypothetical protein
LDLFVSGDQLLRGAALNAVLIAEALLDVRELLRLNACDEQVAADATPRCAKQEQLLATDNVGYQGERAEHRQDMATRFTFVNGLAIGAVVGALAMALFTSSRRW